MAFKLEGQNPEISVYLARLLDTPELCLTEEHRAKRYAVVSLRAQVPLELGLVVEHDGKAHPAHCNIHTGGREIQKKREISRKLAEACIFAFKPNVDWPDTA